MNVGDKLSIFNLQGNLGYINYGGANFTHYFYVIGTYTSSNNGKITADTAVEQSYANTYFDKYISGSWVQQFSVSSSGGEGYKEGNYYLSEGYWRCRCDDYYGYSSYTVYRSYNAPRRQGYYIRKIYSDFSGYIPSSSSGLLYASDANVGQLCTY